MLGLVRDVGTEVPANDRVPRGLPSGGGPSPTSKDGTRRSGGLGLCHCTLSLLSQPIAVASTTNTVVAAVVLLARLTLPWWSAVDLSCAERQVGLYFLSNSFLMKAEMSFPGWGPTTRSVELRFVLCLRGDVHSLLIGLILCHNWISCVLVISCTVVLEAAMAIETGVPSRCCTSPAPEWRSRWRPAACPPTCQRS